MFKINEFHDFARKEITHHQCHDDGKISKMWRREFEKVLPETGVGNGDGGSEADHGEEEQAKSGTCSLEKEV